MLVYLARHGETTANREGIILGRSDAPLTTSGISVIERLGKILTDCDIRSILTSPLARAEASATIIGREIGIPPVPMDDLMELSCGHWEGRPRKDLLGKGKTLRSTWTDCPPGGESCKEAEARVSRLIDIIGRALGKGSVLVVGHAVVNRVLLRLWYQLDPLFASDLTQPHDLVYVLGRKVSVRWLCADGSSGTGWNGATVKFALEDRFY